MKKCLVLDLDNTLWGGVVGEDGMKNIALSLDPPGSGFIAFQQAILDHYHRGVILAINSRNNPDEAWEVIRKHPNMILKENHFAAARINWNDKAENLRELARELNIGLDAMVFLDDDPTNRELARALVPEVETPDMPHDPSQYASFLNSLNCFASHAITDEDTMRGNFYVTERLRKEEEKKHGNKEDFLHGLALELFVHEDDGSCMPRLAQLTEKTNQFNTNKMPFTETEIAKAMASPDSAVFHARLQDKFGDHGVIAFALVDKKKDQWHIRSLLMSCRVFGRGVEDAMLGVMLKRAHEAGARRMTIAFHETLKNEPAREFVETRFFDHSRPVPKTPEFPSWITVREL
ncbi:MAG: HAD-IIIC family phosphatase [Candidatus Sungbacteria bacterium]|nr:HAD-IIIC family phosphatase [Candidatus Sungbacteria bacterium]